MPTIHRLAGLRQAHKNPPPIAQNRLHECKQTDMHLRADLTFWLAYAAKNQIHSDGHAAIAAARAHSLWRGERATVVWPDGRETAFENGCRLA